MTDIRIHYFEASLPKLTVEFVFLKITLFYKQLLINIYIYIRRLIRYIFNVFDKLIF